MQKKKIGNIRDSDYTTLMRYIVHTYSLARTQLDNFVVGIYLASIFFFEIQ